MKKAIFTAIMLIGTLALFSQTTYLVGYPYLHPDIDFDFGSILSAIDESTDGDTIIVYPGEYGHVNFYGKNVYITSLYKYTSNRNDIYNTVIDRGNTGGSAVLIVTNETRSAVLNGFTIQGGIGQQTNTPLVREGGGIFIRNASPTILNCIIKDNVANYRGGGISIHSTGTIISPYLAGNIIKNNHCSTGQGGGINVGNTNEYQIQVIFDLENTNSIFLNDALEYKDIYSVSMSYMNVVLDTFTVATADPFYINMWGDYDFSCDNWKIDQVNQDIYVSVTGNDTNTGVSQHSPLKTINEAMLRINSNPDNRNTIHILPGVYKATEGQIFPVMIKSDVILQGAGQDVTVFDLEGNAGAIHSNTSAKRFKISGIKFINNGPDAQMYGKMAPIVLGGTDNSEISDCYFENNVFGIHTSLWDVPSRTEPIYLKNLSFVNNYNSVLELTLENAVLENIKILDNQVESFGMSVYIFPPVPIILKTMLNSIGNYSLSNVLIANVGDREIMNVGDNIEVLINNTTIVNTISLVPKDILSYRVMSIGRDSNVRTFNSIFYNIEGYITGYTSSTFYIDYSLLLGGPSMVLCPLVWGEGNIDEYPGFDWGYEGVLDWPYQLMASSPCVDAGTVDILDYTWLTGDIMGNTRLVGETVDMGAYEFSGSNDYFVDFEGEPRTGVIPLTVQFTDATVGYDVSSWQWDFNNDGIIDSTEQNPVFTYYSTGHTTVRLVINNGQASRVKPEYINPRPVPITGGTLRGIVTSSGYPLPDAFVAVLGTTLIGTTDDMGMYTIDDIMAGTYNIRAFKEEYESYTHTGVVINIGEVTTQHFALSPVSDSDIVGVPMATRLGGNYPNPFNPETTIAFTLGKQGLVEIDVYNIKGNKVKTLVKEHRGVGNHQVIWDGADDRDKFVGSGIYFYRLKTGDHISTRKMLLLK